MMFWAKMLLECVLVFSVNLGIIRLFPKPNFENWSILITFVLAIILLICSLVFGVFSIGMIIWNI